MSNFKLLMDYCRSEALAAKFEPDEEAVYRFICRSYSKKFATPLYVVETLDPEKVILNYYESQLDEMDLDDNLEDLLDIIYTLEDPNYEREKEEEVQDFMEMAAIEEEERLKNGEPIHPSLKKEPVLNSNQPTSGGIGDLSHLESEEKPGGFD